MKILFIDSVHSILQERLEKFGFQCDIKTKLSKEEIHQCIQNYDGLVIRSKVPVDKEFLDKASNLKFIARSGAGLENIDLGCAAAKNITCFSAPEGNRDAVGEHALGMLLSLFNKLTWADLEIRKGIWNREANRGKEIKGKTIGIIGYGHMGKAFAQRLQGFECEVIAYDKYKKDFSDKFIKEVSLKELQSRADIISFHVPQEEDTIHYVDESFISEFENPIYIINTARGKVIKTKALIEAIKTGKVLGACLDVLEYEKSSFEKIFQQELDEDFEYLVASPKVILSPHVAGWSEESYFKLSNTLANKILDHYQA